MSKPKYAIIADELKKNLGIICQQDFTQSPGSNETFLGAMSEVFKHIRYLERRYGCEGSSALRRLGVIVEAVLTKAGVSAILGKQKAMLTPTSIQAIAGAIHRTQSTSSPTGVWASKRLTRLLVERIDSKEGLQKVYWLFRFGYAKPGTRTDRMQHFESISERLLSHQPLRELPRGFVILLSPILDDAENRLLAAGLLETQVVVA